MSNIWIEIARGGKFERTEWNINSIWLKFRLSIIHGNIHVYILTWREWLRRLWLQIVLSWQHVYCVENPNCLKRVGETEQSFGTASSRIHAVLAFIGKKPPDCQRDGLRSFQLLKYLKFNILVCTPSTEKCFQGWHKHPFNRKAKIKWSFTSDFRIPIFLQSTSSGTGAVGLDF